MNTPNPKLYRPCVGTMMINQKSQVFVGKRIDGRDTDFWQMPQGGVDPGEALEEAALREVEEETGVKSKHLEIVGQLSAELFYDLPPELHGKLWGGKYIGQRQNWFMLRFTGKEKHINLEAHKHPEFCEYQWVEPERVPELIVPFKRDVYQSVLDGFREFL